MSEKHTWDCVEETLVSEPVNLGQIGPVAFGAPVLLEFGWQLETVVEGCNRRIPNPLRSLGKKRKENLGSRVVTRVETPAWSSGKCQWLQSHIKRLCHVFVT